MKTHSRLFAVDADSDPAKLRQQYPDNKRFLIAPAQVRLSYTRNYNVDSKKSERPKLKG